MLYRATPQTARSGGGLRGYDPWLPSSAASPTYIGTDRSLLHKARTADSKGDML